jgi:hypothetical protein
MQTKLIRIDLTNIPGPTGANPNPLESLINNASTIQSAAGLKLISTFIFGTDLMLVFQK